jgi:hypothetical protein
MRSSTHNLIQETSLLVKSEDSIQKICTLSSKGIGVLDILQSSTAKGSVLNGIFYRFFFYHIEYKTAWVFLKKNKNQHGELRV